MKGKFQLRIPMPCHEDWETMRPEERGRFCGACSKTVVDFSMMTDQEVIQYLGRAASGVCGRFAPEQLERDFAVAEGRRRRGWWHWLVAGLLVTAEARGQAVTKGEVVKVERRDEANGKGEVVKVQVLDTVRVVGYGVTGHLGVVGVVDSVPRRDLARAGQELCGMAGGLFVGTRVTSTMWVKDTLAAVGLAPKRELAVYPNPVRRGAAMSLNWQRTEPGTYEVALFSATGALVERRIVEVGSKEQVDLFGLPPALPAGMYFLRAARPGGAKVITLKLIVL